MENKTKGFGLSTLAVNNRKTVFLIALIIIFGGIGAYQSMPKENFPELQIPEIYVGIAKPGSSPEYMSEKIAKTITYSYKITIFIFIIYITKLN